MNPLFVRSMLGGLAGTAVMSMMMYYVAPMMLGQPMDIAAMLGSMLGGVWLLGMILHFVNGTVIFPAVYAFALHGRLKGPPWIRGVVWGAILWLLAQVIVMPMMGGGLFSANAGGAMAVMASLMGHAIYGAILGAVAGTSEQPRAHATA